MTTFPARALRGSLIAGLALAPAAAFAQSTSEAPETPAPEMQEEAQATFTDAELESFVAATMQLQQVRSEYLPQIQAAESEADKQALAREAQTEMAARVEAADGIDVETYNRIGQAAQSDEDLNARIVAMLQESASEAGEG
ncbi:MAG: DUF4168 domain-containing protein [Pseudooceanicola sp.]